MNIAERFGASIDVRRPDADAEGFFFVKRRDDVDHDVFVTGLLGVIGRADRLVLHHRTGFAVVRVSFDRSRRLSRLPWIETVGGIRFDPEQFAAIAGSPD